MKYLLRLQKNSFYTNVSWQLELWSWLLQNTSIEMSEQLFGKLVNQGSKISVIDKALAISHRSGLIIHLKCSVQDFEDRWWFLLISWSWKEQHLKYIKLYCPTQEKWPQWEIFTWKLYVFCTDGASMVLGRKKSEIFETTFGYFYLMQSYLLFQLPLDCGIKR